ncbi:MBL fold metallo-hydrolase [Alphaproteobacteria bacterium]|nr:MBL fold metallo-hydrolase [Alphaproteobacteria bacterium]
MSEADLNTVTFAGCGDAFGSGGRFNTCFVVDVEGLRYAIDFGATSLVALKQVDIAHSSIDVVVISHIHADHCSGIPSMLLDSMLAAKRIKPLIIAGPKDTEQRLRDMMESMLPGSNVMVPKFDLTFIEMELHTPNKIGEHMVVTPYPADHTPKTHPTSLRIEAGGKIVAYSGDTAWTEHVTKVSDGADLFICESYFYQKPISFHLNYPDVVEHWDEFNAKRIILTHMGPEMLAMANRVPEECAYDGLKVEI